MRKLLPLISAFICFALLSCASRKDSTTENGTFGSDGFQVKVESASNLGRNAYKFTVVKNSSFPQTQFSVYGIPQGGDLPPTPPEAYVRLRGENDSWQVGKVFYVYFQPSDVTFAIYRDQKTNSGWQLDTRIDLVSDRLPRSLLAEFGLEPQIIEGGH